MELEIDSSQRDPVKALYYPVATLWQAVHGLGLLALDGSRSCKSMVVFRFVKMTRMYIVGSIHIVDDSVLLSVFRAGDQSVC